MLDPILPAEMAAFESCAVENTVFENQVVPMITACRKDQHFSEFLFEILLYELAASVPANKTSIQVRMDSIQWGIRVAQGFLQSFEGGPIKLDKEPPYYELFVSTAPYSPTLEHLYEYIMDEWRAHRLLTRTITLAQTTPPHSAARIPTNMTIPALTKEEHEHFKHQYAKIPPDFQDRFAVIVYAWRKYVFKTEGSGGNIVFMSKKGLYAIAKYTKKFNIEHKQKLADTAAAELISSEKTTNSGSHHNAGEGGLSKSAKKKAKKKAKKAAAAQEGQEDHDVDADSSTSPPISSATTKSPITKTTLKESEAVDPEFEKGLKRIQGIFHELMFSGHDYTVMVNKAHEWQAAQIKLLNTIASSHNMAEQNRQKSLEKARQATITAYKSRKNRDKWILASIKRMIEASAVFNKEQACLEERVLSARAKASVSGWTYASNFLRKKADKLDGKQQKGTTTKTTTKNSKDRSENSSIDFLSQQLPPEIVSANLDKLSARKDEDLHIFMNKYMDVMSSNIALGRLPTKGDQEVNKTIRENLLNDLKVNWNHTMTTSTNLNIFLERRIRGEFMNEIQADMIMEAYWDEHYIKKKERNRIDKEDMKAAKLSTPSARYFNRLLLTVDDSDSMISDDDDQSDIERSEDESTDDDMPDLISDDDTRAKAFTPHKKTQTKPISKASKSNKSTTEQTSAKNFSYSSDEDSTDDDLPNLQTDEDTRVSEGYNSSDDNDLSNLEADDDGDNGTKPKTKVDTPPTRDVIAEAMQRIIQSQKTKSTNDTDLQQDLVQPSNQSPVKGRPQKPGMSVPNGTAKEQQKPLKDKGHSRMDSEYKTTTESGQDSNLKSKTTLETDVKNTVQRPIETIVKEKTENDPTVKRETESERLEDGMFRTFMDYFKKAESDRIASEKMESERIAREKAEAERIARERAEAERIAREKAEAERIAREKAEAEGIAREKAETERIAHEKAEAERIAREKAEAERIAHEKAEAERIAREKAEAERIAREKAEAEEEGNRAEIRRQAIVDQVKLLREKLTEAIILEENRIESNRRLMDKINANQAIMQQSGGPKYEVIFNPEDAGPLTEDREAADHALRNAEEELAKLSPEYGVSVLKFKSKEDFYRSLVDEVVLAEESRAEARRIETERAKLEAKRIEAEKAAIVSKTKKTQQKELAKMQKQAKRLESQEKERQRQEAEKAAVEFARLRGDPVRKLKAPGDVYYDWKAINFDLPIWKLPSEHFATMEIWVEHWCPQLQSSGDAVMQRAELLDRLETLFKAHFSNVDISLRPFGSHITALGNNYSDIDICVFIEPEQFNTQASYADIRYLAKFLESLQMQHVTAITDAKVPIVKFVDPKSGIHCDMNVQHPLGIYNSEMINNYLEIDERLEKLIVILKYFAKCHGILDGPSGYLCSYAFILMVIVFFQEQEEPILPRLQVRTERPKPVKEKGKPKRKFNTFGQCLQDGSITPVLVTQDSKVYDCTFDNRLDHYLGFGSHNKKTVSQLLFEFFEYFSRKFDYRTMEVSTQYGRIQERHAIQKEKRQLLMASKLLKTGSSNIKSDILPANGNDNVGPMTRNGYFYHTKRQLWVTQADIEYFNELDSKGMNAVHGTGSLDSGSTDTNPVHSPALSSTSTFSTSSSARSAVSVDSSTNSGYSGHYRTNNQPFFCVMDPFIYTRNVAGTCRCEKLEKVWRCFDYGYRSFALGKFSEAFEPQEFEMDSKVQQ
ncbi:hypothetical protein FBU30_009525 [Linnemannia zychae]|nr:hypothetical protein FBU30_009525 [Linnemannia zychae]